MFDHETINLWKVHRLVKKDYIVMQKQKVNT